MSCERKLRSYVYFDSTERVWKICFRGDVPKNDYQSDTAARADMELLIKGHASIEWGCVHDHRFEYNKATQVNGKMAAANDDTFAGSTDIWGHPTK